MLKAMGSNWLDLNDNQNAQIGVVSTLFLAVLALLWLRRGNRAIPPLPPGPRGFPIVGYLPFLSGDLHRQFTQLSTLYGPIYKLWLGGKLCVVVNSPSLVKEVVRDKDVIFANRDPIIAMEVATYGGRDIVTSPYGPEWKKLRKIFVREMLSNTILDNLYSLRREELKKSIKNVYEKIGEEIDIGNLSFVTVINAVMSMLWGGKLEGENVAIVDGVEFKRAAAKLMVLFGRPNVSDFFPAIAWLDLQGIERETREIKDLFGVMLDSAIEKRRKLNVEERRDGDRDERKDFLQFLLELHDVEMSITTDQLKALLIDTVVGGTDTTTTIVEWTMAELLKYPEVMNKVQEELTQVVGLNYTVEEFHLSQLNYLNAAIKETFRLHPTLPFLVPRCPSQSATIGGYHIPKGTRVFLNVWAIQRDPSLWEDPLEFRPERFLNDPNKYDYSGNNFHFLPFGSGRRLCAGLPLAEKMMVYILASFLHSFDWKLPLNGKLELSDRFGIVTKKSEPLIAIPTPRLSNLELYR